MPNAFSGEGKSRFDQLSFVSKVKYSLNSVYSIPSLKTLREVLRKHSFDIVHLQNIHHVLTSSIFAALKDVDTPIVWTLHDFKLICPSSNFFTAGAVCERCRGGKFYNALIHRCKRGSLAGSALAAAISYLDRVMTIRTRSDIFVTPSRFLRSKLTQYGFDPTRVVTVPLFVSPLLVPQEGEIEDFVLYYGNFSKEKGVGILLEVARRLPHLRFLFVGSGPLLEDVTSSSAIRGSNVTCLPYQSKAEMITILKKARLVVVPSQWYENFPFTVLESMSAGKAVIASRIGGIPEQIDNNNSGLLIDDVASVDEWAAKIGSLYQDKDKIKRLGHSARQLTITCYGEDLHYRRMLSLYEGLINTRGNI